MTLRGHWCLNEHELVRYKNDWQQLSQGMPLFYQYFWFKACWQWRKNDAKLCCYFVFDESQLVAIFPLIQSNATITGLKIKQLEFLSVPDSSQCDVIVKNKYQQSLIPYMWTFFKSSPLHWDRLYLHYLPSNSQIERWLNWQNMGHCIKVSTLIPAITNTVSPGELAHISKKRLQRFAKQENNLKKHFQLKIHHIKEINAHALFSMIKISKHSWKSVTGNTLNYKGPNEFIRNLSRSASEQGYLSAYLLQLDNEAVAMEYHLCQGKNHYALRGDYKQVHESLSIGSYLNYYIIKHLFENDTQRYLMGPGLNSYKLKWANTSYPVSTAKIHRWQWLNKVFWQKKALTLREFL